MNKPLSDEEIKKKLSNLDMNNNHIGTMFKKTYRNSKIICTDIHHDCFSRNIYNEYVVLQIMFVGIENNKSMFLVEFIKDRDFKKENDLKK